MRRESRPLTRCLRPSRVKIQTDWLTSLEIISEKRCLTGSEVRSMWIHCVSPLFVAWHNMTEMIIKCNHTRLRYQLHCSLYLVHRLYALCSAYYLSLVTLLSPSLPLLISQPHQSSIRLCTICPMDKCSPNATATLSIGRTPLSPCGVRQWLRGCGVLQHRAHVRWMILAVPAAQRLRHWGGRRGGQYREYQ